MLKIFTIAVLVGVLLGHGFWAAFAPIHDYASAQRTADVISSTHIKYLVVGALSGCIFGMLCVGVLKSKMNAKHKAAILVNFEKGDVWPPPPEC